MAGPETIDEYIARTEGSFAHPILVRVREIVHQTVPGIKESIKWGSPMFEYNGNMMSMVAFKKFAAVWFHKGALFSDPGNLLEASSESTKSMRKYLIPSVDDLDEEGLKELILEAVEKQESGEQVKGFKQKSDQWDHSDLLSDALKKDPKAKKEFEKMTDYKKREFIEHIESAKRDDTKRRRLQKSLKLLHRGQGLHDKYR